MIAYVLVAAAFSGRHIKINNLGVDILAELEGRDEWADVLEGSTAHQLGCRVFQEPVVDLGKLLCLILNTSHFGYLGHLIRTSFSHLLLAVQSQLIIQWENLVLEELK